MRGEGAVNRERVDISSGIQAPIVPEQSSGQTQLGLSLPVAGLGFETTGFLSRKQIRGRDSRDRHRDREIDGER